MFEQIKKDSLEAWDKFNQFYFSINTNRLRETYLDSIDIWSIIGDLLLFFDEQGIIIEVESAKNDKWIFKIIMWGKSRKYVKILVQGKGFNSRSEAWEMAIPKAFEILQKQLEEK